VRELGILNTSQPHASSRSRDAKFTSEVAERYNLVLPNLYSLFKEQIQTFK